MKRLDTENNFVVILDCLPNSDRNRHGLAKAIQDYLAQQGIEQFLGCCDCKPQLLGGLSRCKQMAEQQKVFSIHFVAHGNSSGIGIGNSSEIVTWADLRQHLCDINDRMQKRLIVNMTSCFGLHGIKITEPHKDGSPFFGIIGTKESIAFSEALEASKGFYAAQIAGKEIPKCVREANTCLKKMAFIASPRKGTRQSGRARTLGSPDDP